MSRRWAVLGCGYVGQRLALRLLETGHEVLVTSRTDLGKDALRAALPGARAQRYRLGDELGECSQYDVLVICCPPDPSAPDAERALAQQVGPGQRLLYLSTTGVYAAAKGADVTDGYTLGPASERSERRLRVERALQETGSQSVSLRIPGIYGPGRGVHARMQAGKYRLIGAANTLVSRIYVDDLVAAIVLLGEAQTLEHQSYVIGDEEPTTATDHARGVAARLGLAMPPTVPASDVSAAVRNMLGADRRIVPQRLLALGWRAQYPSWREGLEQALSDENPN